MTTPLAPVWLGNIQQEETRAKAPVSEYVQQKIGSNVMFLKSELNRMLGALNAYAAAGGLAVQLITSVGSGVTLNSPSGKPYYGGILAMDSPIMFPAILVPGITSVQYTGIPSLYQTYIISGNQVLMNGAIVANVSGAMLYIP